MVMIPVASEPASTNDTSAWRTQTPVLDYSSCIRCMLCWKFCPDDAITVSDGKGMASPGERISSMPAPVIDYDHCKGCGICAYECPEDSISMKVGGGVVP